MFRRNGISSVFIITSLLLSTLWLSVPQVKCAETTLFFDNFEDYAVGTKPSPPWEFPWCQNASITNMTYASSTKSLRMLGFDSWTADAVRSFSSNARFIGFEAEVKSEMVPSKRDSVRVSFISGSTEYAEVCFTSDGLIWTGGPAGPIFPLQSYEANTWYEVRVLLDRQTGKYSIWIDGVLRTTEGMVNDPVNLYSNRFDLKSGNGNVYCDFDNARVFALSTTCTVNLESREEDNSTYNLGNIVFDGTPYPLSYDLTKEAGNYSIQYIASTGYEFDHWETTSGVKVTSPNAQSTSVTVGGNCNITAVYKKQDINYMIYLASKEENGTVSNLGIIQFDNQSFTLPNNVAKPSAVYLICYVPASGNIFLRWEASSNIAVGNTTSQQTTAMINGTGTVTAIFGKHAPELPVIGEVKAFYTLNSFFLAGMSNLVPPNQYFIRGSNISVVEFIIYLGGEKQVYIDTSPDSLGRYSSNYIDMAQVTSNLTIIAYSETGNHVNLTLSTNVFDTPYWLKTLIEVAKETRLISIIGPGYGSDNIWTLNMSVNWPPSPLDETVSIPVPIIGGKYGVEGSFSFVLYLQSNKKVTAGGGGSLCFYVADAEVGIGMYLTATERVDNEIKLEDLLVQVLGRVDVPFKHKYAWDTPIGSIGLEVGVWIGGSVSLNLHVREASSGNGTFGHGFDWVRSDSEVSLWLRPYAAVGYGLGEVMIEGEGKVTFTVHVPEPYFNYPDDLRLDARITLILRCWGLEVWRKDVFRYSSGSPVTWTRESSESGWIPRTWSNGNYSIYAWIGNSTEGTYLKNVYLYANPSIAASAENTMMVWTHDNLSKPFIQGYEVYYSVWNENKKTWSLPAALTDNSIPESDAVVKFDSAGNAVAVWAQINKPFLNETTDPFSIFNMTELAFAVWNHSTSTWSQTKLVTNDYAYDFSPALVSDENGNLMLVWMSDADGDVSTYNDQSIYTSTWNCTEWSNLKHIASPGLIASQVNGGLHDGKAALVWTQHTDSDTTSLNDTEVFYSELLGDSWSPPSRLTNNTFEDTMPCIAFWNDHPVFTLVERTDNETNTLVFLDPYGDNAPRSILKRPKIHFPMLTVDSNNRIVAVWTDNILPYSAVLNPNEKIMLSEIIQGENQTGRSIYCSIYEYSAGMVDVNYDGQINILDIAIVARAFGAVPGKDAWNQEADLDSDKAISIIDVAKVAKEFQKGFSDYIHCRNIINQRTSEP